MGLSTLKGNSGYIGRDFRSTSGTTSIGTMSVQKHYLERRNERLGPPPPPPQGNNIIFSENFETGDFSRWISYSGTSGVRNASDGINVVNEWIVTDGTGVTGIPYSGTNSAYISSSDTNPAWSYSSIGTGNPGPLQRWRSHIFWDFTGSTSLPEGVTGYTLTFAWNCNAATLGEDYGYVMFVDGWDVQYGPDSGLNFAGFPEAGVAYTGAELGALTNGGQFDSNYVTYTSPTAWHNETLKINNDTMLYNWWNSSISGNTNSLSPGGTGRLVFSWTNDRTTENDPPMAIDNILLTWHPCPDGYDCYQEGL